MRDQIDLLIETLELLEYYIETLTTQLVDTLIAIHFCERARQLARFVAVRDELEDALHALADGSPDGHEVIAAALQESERHIVFIEQSASLREIVFDFFNPPHSSFEALA